MKVPRQVWFWGAGVACLFNAGAGVYAWMIQQDTIHGAIHMVLTVIFGLLAWRLRGTGA